MSIIKESLLLFKSLPNLCAMKLIVCELCELWSRNSLIIDSSPWWMISSPLCFAYFVQQDFRPYIKSISGTVKFETTNTWLMLSMSGTTTESFSLSKGKWSEEFLTASKEGLKPPFTVGYGPDANSPADLCCSCSAPSSWNWLDSDPNRAFKIS